MIEANSPQGDFLMMDKKFKAFVAGFGSGKTFVGCISQCLHFRQHPRINQGYFAPTYPQIRDIFYPTMEEVAHAFGLTVKVKSADKEVHVFLNGKLLGVTLCRSMNDPSTIVGFKIGRALVDEIDTLATNKARDAWRKIIARMRYRIPKVKNGIDVTTTPEGFRFVYEQFALQESEHYGMIQASTYDNELNLPDDYIPSLLDTYPEELIQAYLEGQFINLTSGSVYPSYDRVRCGCDSDIVGEEPLYIGQDFNVHNMSSVIYVKRREEFHAVRELSGGRDTPTTIETIQEKFPKHPVIMYPDASGQNTSSKSASTSDISLLKAAGFNVRVRLSNPTIKDRVLSSNIAFQKGHVKVNARTCPEFAKSLEQQAYTKDGVPDKSTGHDHMNDAGTYPIVYEFPVKKPAIKTRPMAGL